MKLNRQKLAIAFITTGLLACAIPAAGYGEDHRGSGRRPAPSRPNPSEVQQACNRREATQRRQQGGLGFQHLSQADEYVELNSWVCDLHPHEYEDIYYQGIDSNNPYVPRYGPGY